MKRAIVETATGYVQNVIIIEDGADWICPDGCELIDARDLCDMSAKLLSHWLPLILPIMRSLNSSFQA